jgi:hypothetical protein
MKVSGQLHALAALALVPTEHVAVWVGRCGEEKKFPFR